MRLSVSWAAASAQRALVLFLTPGVSDPSGLVPTRAWGDQVCSRSGFALIHRPSWPANRSGDSLPLSR